MALPLMLAGAFLVFALIWLCLGSGVATVSPTLYFNDSTFNHSVLSHCPMLLSPYIPTWLWGKSGHIQTIIYGKMGRVNTPLSRGLRYQEVLLDGATMSYDVFEPINKLKNGGDCTLLLCPGIANSSESAYILTCVHYAQENGFRCAVLNHLGALSDVALTSPRIYTYGGTGEYSVMVKKMMEMYPRSQFIAVGFSMGANIVIKFLGEHQHLQSRFIGAMSCCQGYDVLEAAPFLLSWQGGRYLYIRAMTEHQKSLLRRHRNILFSPMSMERYGQFNVNKILSATTMLDIDEHYSHRRAGFNCWQDYYQWSSSRFYINNIHIPVLLLNALDDPLVPPELHYIPREFAQKRDNVIFAVTRHGGHLGYFEGGFVMPDTVTWLDRLVVEFCTALMVTINESSLKVATFPTTFACCTESQTDGLVSRSTPVGTLIYNSTPVIINSSRHGSAAIDSTPVVSDSTPVMPDGSVISKSTPVVNDSTPVVPDGCVISNSTPVVNDSTSVVPDGCVISNSTPVVSDSMPDVTKVSVVITDTEVNMVSNSTTKGTIVITDKDSSVVSEIRTTKNHIYNLVVCTTISLNSTSDTQPVSQSPVNVGTTSNLSSTSDTQPPLQLGKVAILEKISKNKLIVRSISTGTIWSSGTGCIQTEFCGKLPSVFRSASISDLSVISADFVFL